MSGRNTHSVWAGACFFGLLTAALVDGLVHLFGGTL